MSDRDRLTGLRAALSELGVDGLVVPRADEHLGAHVPPSGARLAWLSGFTGSAGLAIVLPERAALFTDGRYTTQAERQTDPALWERRHLTEQPPAEWLRAHAAGRRVGYDPWLHPRAALDRLAASGAVLVPLEANPLDALWTDRPAPPASPAEVWPDALAGRSAAEKREALAAELRAAGHSAVVLSDPHSVAWLLNMRGRDLDHTPLALAFALLRDDASVEVFLDPGRAGRDLRVALGNAVSFSPRAVLPASLSALSGRKVRVDPEATPVWFAETLRAAGAEVSPGPDPCRLPRSTKTGAEQAGARAAHRRDGRALIRFLRWFEGAAPAGGETEMSAGARLLALRGEEERFRGESFPAITGAGENGAIIHYRATPETDRPVRPDEVFLLDSGGQYLDGTTDVTRTVWTGPGPAPAEIRARATRVLRGLISLATLRFPEGVAGPHLDALARRPLWDAGEDYDHGTGHGVGAHLSVHEGPVAFARTAADVALREGMILSDEPGFYLPGQYGIRLEILLLVLRDEAVPGPRRWLRFETLTLVPFDRRLIEPGLLLPAERAWLDAYHARVLAEIGPTLGAEDAAWLRDACAPL